MVKENEQEQEEPDDYKQQHSSIPQIENGIVNLAVALCRQKASSSGSMVQAKQEVAHFLKKISDLISLEDESIKRG